MWFRFACVDAEQVPLNKEGSAFWQHCNRRQYDHYRHKIRRLSVLLQGTNAPTLIGAGCLQLADYHFLLGEKVEGISRLAAALVAYQDISAPLEMDVSDRFRYVQVLDWALLGGGFLEMEATDFDTHDLFKTAVRLCESLELSRQKTLFLSAAQKAS